MKLNFFEGARRVAMVLGLVWVGGCVWYAVVNEPFVSGMVFSIAAPGEAPKKVDTCGDDDAIRYIAQAPLVPVPVTLCFSAKRVADGRMLIPYPTSGVSVRMPDGTIIENVPEGLGKGELLSRLKASGYDVNKLMAGQAIAEPVPVDAPSAPSRFEAYALGKPFSANVSEYTARVEKDFRFPSQYLPEAEQQRHAARVGQMKLVGLVMVGVLAVGWLCVATVGWVVRGFFGIPRGKDARPE